MMQGASLGKVLSLGFGEGFLGSAAAQGLLNEDGEINWALAIGDGMFSAVMAGLVWNDINRKIEKSIIWVMNVLCGTLSKKLKNHIRILRFLDHSR